jgi:hypothetical protein
MIRYGHYGGVGLSQQELVNKTETGLEPTNTLLALCNGETDAIPNSFDAEGTSSV